MKILLLLFVAHGASETVRNEIICEDKIGKIACNNQQVIEIIDANYGRTQNEPDCGGPILTSCCIDETSKTKICQMCEGERKCTLSVSNEDFEDQCYGTKKYLNVTYTCTDNTDVNGCNPMTTSTNPQTTAEYISTRETTEPSTIPTTESNITSIDISSLASTAVTSHKTSFSTTATYAISNGSGSPSNLIVYVGISVGVFVFLLVVTFSLVYAIKRKRRSSICKADSKSNMKKTQSNLSLSPNHGNTNQQSKTFSSNKEMVLNPIYNMDAVVDKEEVPIPIYNLDVLKRSDKEEVLNPIYNMDT